MISRIFVLVVGRRTSNLVHASSSFACVCWEEQGKRVVITEQYQAGYEAWMQTWIFFVINFDVERQSKRIV
jgi:hypothetical protein